MRHINVEVDLSEGVLGEGELSADYPWNLFSSVTLADVNGAPIYGPIDLYATLWANIIGGYAGGANDPRALPDYVSTINAKLRFRIPIEISHFNGFGSLANQNAAASYKLYFTLNPSATLFKKAPTTLPKVRIRPQLEAWSLPNEVDVAGRPQAETPPRLGTTQYHSFFLKEVAAGQNTVQLPRVGNLIRYLLIIARDDEGTRSDGVFPNPVELQWDARMIRRDTRSAMIQTIREKVPDLVARDTGVFAYPFTISNHNFVGDDAPTLWYPTVQSTRLEIDGATEEAGRLQIVTCDVAPAEVRPEERYVENSATGFHPLPAGGAPVVG
jgi:hypothetical protein